MVRRTKEEAEATRVQLLDAAERCFREKGVASTTLDDIAKSAGHTRGAVYWHFENKADIFEAVCERVSTPMQAMLSDLAADPGDDPLGYLRNDAIHVLRMLAECERVQSVFEIKFCKLDGGPDFDRLRSRELETHTRCLSMLEVVFAAAVRQGQLPAYLPPKETAEAMHAFIGGLMRSWIERRDFDLRARAPWLVDTFLTGLRSAPDPAAYA
ncbi:TetR family transcriptional regulator [Methyloversatilis discipulorum]|uniref:TetR family transcriptional regulator n=1 Tax=Methyloversatilis discipulorum TaxID=1119528 RepID=UPI001A3789AC|nr:TetR family transcriptional regulator [Methyloversatilis discipulorum]MBL8468530.1 TetR family transcriptional regulator [Methyloversatilis discipulorum]